MVRVRVRVRSGSCGVERNVVNVVMVCSVVVSGMDREEFSDRLSALIAEARKDVSPAHIMAALVTRVRVLLALEYGAGYDLDGNPGTDADADADSDSYYDDGGGSSNSFRVDDDLR